MNRRGFIGSIILAAAAPAIVRANSLMPGRGYVIPFSHFPASWEGLPREAIQYVIRNDEYMVRHDIIFSNGRTQTNIEQRVRCDSFGEPDIDDLTKARKCAGIMFSLHLSHKGESWSDVIAPAMPSTPSFSRLRYIDLQKIA